VRAYSLVVVDGSTTVTNAAQSLRISGDAIPSGVVGADYYGRFHASGGEGSYAWKISWDRDAPDGVVFDRPTGVLFGAAGEPGDWRATVSVTDAAGAVASSPFVLSFLSSPLYLTSGTPPPGLVCSDFSFRFRAQGGRPPYTWQAVGGSPPEGVEIDLVNGLLKGRASEAGETSLRVRVTDQLGGTDTAEFPLLVSPAPLTIMTDALREGITGSPYLQPLGAAGGSCSYTWEIVSGVLPPGLQLEGDLIRGTPVEVHDALLVIMLTDGSGESAVREFSLTVRGGGALAIETPPVVSAVTHQPIRHEVRAVGGRPPYIWSGRNIPLPGWVRIGISGAAYTLSGTPDKDGEFAVPLEVQDSAGEVVRGSVRLSVETRALSITTDQLPGGVIGSPYETSFVAHGGIPPYRWSLLDGTLPAGLQVEGDRLAGTPVEEAAALVTVAVQDSAGESVERRFDLSITREPLRLLGEKTTLPRAVQDGTYSFTWQATGGSPFLSPDGESYRWSVTGLPQGVVLDPVSGRVEGAPDEAGEFALSVAVRDRHGAFVTSGFVLDVTPSRLRITTGPAGLPPLLLNEPFTLQMEARGGVPPYRWQLDASENSPLQIGAATGAVTARLTSDVPHYANVTVSDSAGDTATVEFVFQPEVGALEIVSAEFLPGQHFARPVSLALEAGGGETPYTWDLVTGDLPPGVILENGGAFSGTPEETGLYDFTAAVTDAAGSRTTASFVFEVLESEIGPVRDLQAYPSDQKVALTWANPDSDTFDRVVVVYQAGVTPATPDDGRLAYEGTGQQVLVSGLEAGETYSFAAFALTAAGDVSVLDSTSKVSQNITTFSLSPRRGFADPHGDQVAEFSPLSANGFGAANLPDAVLGPPAGSGGAGGSTRVVSLHARANDGTSPGPFGGSITIEFRDNLIVDGPGVDFTVFENVFRKWITSVPGVEERFMEPATVAVSQDGFTFYTFPFDFVPHYNPDNTINCSNPFCYQFGFAGVTPTLSQGISPDPTDPAASGGDSFDLETLGVPGLDWVRFVKITATGDNAITDINGDPVRHIDDPVFLTLTGEGKSGFDLDAVTAVNY